MLKALDHRPCGPVGGDREPELETFRPPVLALAAYGKGGPVAAWRCGADAVHGIDDRVGRRRRRRQTARFDHRGAPLLDRVDEVALEPAVVLDHLEGRAPANL